MQESKLKIPTLIFATMLALGLAGAACAAAPAIDMHHEAAQHDGKIAPVTATDSDTDLVQAPASKDAVQQDAAAAPVPEPQTFLMMLIGLVLVGMSSRREASEKFTN